MTPEEEAKEKDPQDSIKRNIDWLFSSHIQRDISDELKDIVEYFSFLAQGIEPRTFTIKIRQDLIQCFESVYLLLLDKLRVYPDPVRNQVITIIKDNHICDIMAVAGSIGTDDITRIRFKNAFQAFMGLFPFIGTNLKINIDSEEYIYINRKDLFKLRVAFNRLSSILTYAASIKLVDYDESFYKFKENYDPDLIDKNKILAFINILHVQVNSHPESKQKNVILEKLENIETELRRPKVRWGIIITGFFILFGFLADLKTIKPDIYKEPYAIVQKVLVTIHEDGVVRGESPRLLENKGVDDTDTEHIDPPGVALPPKREKSEDD